MGPSPTCGIILRYDIACKEAMTEPGKHAVVADKRPITLGGSPWATVVAIQDEEERPAMTLADLRKTSDSKLAGTIRIVLAVLFLMTGAMKLLIPMLAEAWSGQLLAANIPLYTVSRWTVPFLEVALGAVLAVGAFVRPAAVVVMGIMVVATYVHLVVADPSLFPLQPSEPIIPLILIVMSVYVLWRGAGAWSLDLRATRAAA